MCQGSERTNIILFLTDGNPNDADKAQIYQEIEEGQERLVSSLSLNHEQSYEMTNGLMNFKSDTISMLKSIRENMKDCGRKMATKNVQK